MKHLAIILVIAACSGGTKKGSTTADNGSAAVYAKKISISWGITQGDGSAQVFLQT